MVAALNAVEQFKTFLACPKTSANETFLACPKKFCFSENTVIGALARYISTPNEKFQPMNANFGIVPPLEGKKIKDKKQRYQMLADRSLIEFE